MELDHALRIADYASVTCFDCTFWHSAPYNGVYTIYTYVICRAFQLSDCLSK